jgi:hypothetical protein
VGVAEFCAICAVSAALAPLPPAPFPADGPCSEPPKDRGTEIRPIQSIDMTLKLFLELVGRLMRILAQAGLVDIATVHADVTVDDHHRALSPGV